MFHHEALKHSISSSGLKSFPPCLNLSFPWRVSEKISHTAGSLKSCQDVNLILLSFVFPIWFYISLPLHIASYKGSAVMEVSFCEIYYLMFLF